MVDSHHTSLRLDKWLWAARFYKTRSLATQAVNRGKVQVDEQRVKPARTVSPGCRIRIRKGAVEWEITVREISAQRRSAPEAATLYEELAESVERRLAYAEKRRLANQERWLDPGRPSREERRDMLRLKRQ